MGYFNRIIKDYLVCALKNMGRSEEMVDAAKEELRWVLDVVSASEAVKEK